MEPLQSVVATASVFGPGYLKAHIRVREIDDDEGKRLVRIVRRGTGSVVTWRRDSRSSPLTQAAALRRSY